MAHEPFSSRTDWDRQSNALSLAQEELKSKSVEVMDLTESNPTRCGFHYSLEILHSLFNPQNLQYDPDARGNTAARQAVGEFCGFDPARVFLTASTSESYSFLFRLLLNPGDKVLIPKPSYPLFQFLLGLNDAEFDQYPLSYDGHAWHIDFKQLERLIDADTKAIVLVNPNNPTGSYIKTHELKILNALCVKHNLTIISDEVFYDYPLAQGQFVSLKGNADVLTFVLGGLSKSMAMPQMKLGWILTSGPNQVVEEALHRLEIIADTYLSVNTPVQNALSSWFPEAAAMQAQIIARVKENLNVLGSCGLPVLAVEGGWYAILDIGSIDEEELALKILRQDHIFVHPGYYFDMDEGGHLVVSLLPELKAFAKMIKTLVERYNEKTKLG